MACVLLYTSKTLLSVSKVELCKIFKVFFHFSEKYAHTYNGVRRARGISCDVYTFPVTQTNMDGSVAIYNMFWYFTTQQWTYDNGLPGTRAPVRMVLLGNYTTADGSTTTQINTQYEIYNFMPFIPIPNVFDIPATLRCNLSQNTQNIFAIFKLSINPNSFDYRTFANSLATQLNTSFSNIDIIDVLQEKSNVWHTIVITMLYASTPSQITALNNTLLNLVFNLPTTMGSYPGIDLDYSLSLDCGKDCQTGRCHFGLCVCDDGWSGQYCDTHILNFDDSGQTSIVVDMDFENFSGTSFIIGFCFLFIGVLIGYVIFKWRYKLQNDL